MFGLVVLVVIGVRGRVVPSEVMHFWCVVEVLAVVIHSCSGRCIAFGSLLLPVLGNLGAQRLVPCMRSRGG